MDAEIQEYEDQLAEIRAALAAEPSEDLKELEGELVSLIEELRKKLPRFSVGSSVSVNSSQHAKIQSVSGEYPNYTPQVRILDTGASPQDLSLPESAIGEYVEPTNRLKHEATPGAIQHAHQLGQNREPEIAASASPQSDSSPPSDSLPVSNESPVSDSTPSTPSTAQPEEKPPRKPPLEVPPLRNKPRVEPKRFASNNPSSAIALTSESPSDDHELKALEAGKTKWQSFAKHGGRSKAIVRHGASSASTTGGVSKRKPAARRAHFAAN